MESEKRYSYEKLSGAVEAMIEESNHMILGNIHGRGGKRGVKW